MKAEIKKGIAKGEIQVPRSKSMAHRYLIAASLAQGVSHIDGITDCADVRATVAALRSMGVKIDIKDNLYTVEGIDIKKAAPLNTVFCDESGSTLRFLIPIFALCGKEIKFSGAGRLMERPLSVYEDIYRIYGYDFKLQGGILTVCGTLPAGEYRIRGDISSQFITGLIFTLSQAGGNSIIHIEPPFESRSYVNMTLKAIREFGVDCKFLDQYTIGIESGRYLPCNISCEGDYSGAAFMEALNLFGGEVHTLGLDKNSAQGDKVYLEHFNTLKGGYAEIDISDCPDLAPILFTAAALLHGGYFTGTARLKIKESDRALAMKAELEKIGIRLDVGENSVRVYNSDPHSPTSAIESHNDHRIVMSMAIALTVIGGEIYGAEAVAKSYPDFFKHLRHLGIEVIEHDT